MLTGLLRTLLYFILILILLWATTIFFGPSVLKYATQKYYGEKIKLIGLEVSPRLKISASRVEFNNLLVQNIGERSGFVRAASLSLKNYKEGKLFFELSTGPIEIYKTAKIASTSALVSIESFKASEEIGLVVNFKNLESQGKLFVESFNGEGRLNPTTKNLHEIDFGAEGISGNFAEQLSVNIASGSVDRVDFNQPFETSVSNFSILLEKVATENKIFLIEKALVQGSLGLDDQRLDINLNDLKYLDDPIASFINIKRRGNGLIKDRIWVFSYAAGGIDLSQIETSPFSAAIRQISGETDFEDNGKISVSGLGDFESFELVSGSQYIADLSGTRFEFDLQLSHQLNELQSGSRFSLAISNDPLVVFDGDLALRMGGNSVFGCVLNGCNLTELLLKYNLSAGDTSLVGSSLCIENKCTLDDFRHSIKTSDTRKFFMELITSKVFSPLALIAAQSQLQQGVEVGGGHELKF